MKPAAIVDLAQRLGERLALLAGHDQRDVLAVGDDEVEPEAQDFRPLLGKPFRPWLKRALGRLDRADGLGMAEARDLGDQRPGRRIMDGVDPLAHPGAVDQALALQKGWIGEFHGAASENAEAL